MLLRRLAPLAAVALVFAASARADADPASDVLYTQRIFFPFFGEGRVSTGYRKALKKVVDSAWTKGYQVKVALIASQSDLGGVPNLFGQPQMYADFLGRELVFLYKGALVTAMPQGLGFFHYQQPVAKEKRLLSGMTVAGSDGDSLAAAAIGAVSKLAHVQAPKVSASPSGSSKSDSVPRWTLIVIIVGGVAVLAAMVVLGPAAVRRRRAAS